MADPATQVTDARLIAHVAAYHVAHGDLEAAHAALESLLPVLPIQRAEQEAIGAVWCDIARAYVRRGAPAAAGQALANARTLIEGIDVWRIEASIAELSGETETALALWRRIAAAEPNNGTTWQALARACEEASQTREAVEAYLKAAQLDPSHSTILRIARSVARLAPPTEEPASAERVRIAIIGSSTLDHLQAYLEVYCRTASFTPSFYLGAFDQYAPEILDPAGALYAFDPEVIIVVIHGRALFPDLYQDSFETETLTRREAADAVVSRVSTLLTSLTARTKATVLFHTFATPQYSPLGPLDLRDDFGQSALFATINECLAARVRRDFPSVYLIDEDRIYGRIGKRNVTDPRLWSLA
ncbi:MAG: tetratricopeptide repeat protein, partial [Chloroflexota bacterium]